MAARLVLVMGDGCITELADGGSHWVASFDRADVDCPDLADHILTTVIMLRSKRPGRRQ